MVECGVGWTTQDAPGTHIAVVVSRHLCGCVGDAEYKTHVALEKGWGGGGGGGGWEEVRM